ncbi:MAG: hypothetical protein HDKAJFGB_03643 [Anaerolineae bacterium]|nr:hypothetical protein [Anaerolineae bacterium]
MFTHIKIVTFHFDLRLFDGARDERHVNHHLFVLPHFFEQIFIAHAFHDFVFERNIKTRRAGVALPPCAPAQLIVNAARFVAFRADDVQAAELNHLRLFGVGLSLRAFERVLPLRRLDGFAQVNAFFTQFFARDAFRVAAEQNVHAAPRHICRHRDRAEFARLRDNARFAFVILGVEDFVLDAFAAQHFRQHFGMFDRSCADQHGTTLRVHFFDFVHDRFVFGLFVFVNNVRIVRAYHRAIGRNDDNFQAVNFAKFFFFGFRRAGHAREFVVHAKIILERNRGERQRFALHLDVFFGFDGLMQTFGITTPEHEAAREFVHNDHFAIAHDVIFIEFKERVRFERIVKVRSEFEIIGVVNGFIGGDAERALYFFNARFGGRHDAQLEVNGVILVLYQARHDGSKALIFARRFFGRSRNNQRRARFVNQDIVHFVHDGVMQFALYHLRQIHHHVVA